MRKFTNSDVFVRMNTGNALTQKIMHTLKSIDDRYIINDKLSEILKRIARNHRDSAIIKTLESINKREILILTLPLADRFPANIPFVNTKRYGKPCVVIDFSKYTTVEWDESNSKIISVDCDADKLYATIIPAFMSLKLFNEETIVSATASYQLAYLWAKMFNRILMAQKVFVNSEERYEGFMYFAMKFFMKYYMQASEGMVEKVCSDYLKGPKSSIITHIESVLASKDIDLYKDWPTFAYYMFSNEITQMKSISNVDMTVDQYVRLFSISMGRDAAYLALWSVDYFFYCIFTAFEQVYILNDRAWTSIVLDNDKAFNKLMVSLYKEY